MVTSVNHASSSGRFGAIPNRPLPDLVGACGEEAAEVECFSHGDDDFRKSGLGPEVLAFLGGRFFGVETSEALFERHGDGYDRVTRCVLLDPFRDFRQMLVLLADVVFFAQVDQIDNGLRRQQEQRVDDFDLQRCQS